MVTEDVTCPECGSTVTIDPTAETLVPVWIGGKTVIDKKVRCVVAFCNGCEWSHQIPEKFLKGFRHVRL